MSELVAQGPVQRPSSTAGGPGEPAPAAEVGSLPPEATADPVPAPQGGRFTIPPAVLSHLVEQGWQRQPLVVEQALPTAFLTEQEAFDAWRSFVENVPASRWGDLIRLYRGSARVPNLPQFLPTAADTSWDSYLQRLGEQNGAREWGLCLTDPQYASAKIFRRVLVFLDCLFGRTGIPRGGCNMNIFMMNHEESFFRLHKDNEDVFTFVVKGRRRFLLWPFETFAGIAGLNASQSRVPHLLFEVDYQAYRSQAVVLEAAAGDLLYWPAEWWHVGESDGELSITLAIGAIHDGNPMGQIAGAADRLLRRRRERMTGLPWQTADTAGRTVASYTEWMQDLLADDDLWAEVRRGVMSWVTRCGLKRIPPPARRSAPLDDAQWLAVTSPSTIAFEGDEASLFCSIGGHDLALPPGAAAMALLAVLSRGGVHRVGALIDDALAHQPAVDRQQIRALLETIEANYGFERLASP